MPADFAQQFFAFDLPRRFSARWIWDAGETDPQNAVRLFRREFALDDPPDKAIMHIAADTRYQLFVNGRFVGRGAPQSQPYFQYYDSRDVAEHLRAGDNCVAVLVYHLGTMPICRGGLLAELVDADGRTLLATDATWRVTDAKAYWPGGYRFPMNAATPFQEWFDARQWPVGWDAPGFDDGAWAPATVVRGRHNVAGDVISDRPPVAGPWSYLLPRDIPDMTDTTVRPQRLLYVEQCLDLLNRHPGNDLSVRLSAAGTELTHVRLDDPDALCRADGRTVAQCSTEHLDPDRDRPFDGVYDPCVVLDFGRVVTGYARIDVEGPAGGTVDIGYVERLIDGRFANNVEGQFADRLTLSGRRETYQPLNWKAFRYIKLRFSQCSEPATVYDFCARESTYPYELRGRFESADETLNGVFEISRATLRLCSNEFLMDTPHREQAQWLGDVSAVTLGGIYACFGDPALPSKYIRQVAANQMPTGMLANISNQAGIDVLNTIPDYSLWWVWGLWNHYLYTGESRWIHEYYPTALRAMQAHWRYVDEFGLIRDLPYWAFVDWANVDRRGQCAAINGIYAAAMTHLGHMAEMVGDAHHAAKARLGLDRLGETFFERLYDPARGAFADANVDGQLSEMTSEHASMTAIWAGLCPPETAEEIVRRFYEERSLAFVEAQPFYTSVVLAALRRIGRMDLALRIVRDRWGKRMLQQGATSTYEEWTQNGTWRLGRFVPVMRTHSHAWSAAPAEFLLKSLIGLEILTPGGAAVRVVPAETDFDYDVTYPLPAGEVRVTRRGGQCEIHATGDVTVQS